jgi:hypothetical protein
MNNFLCPFCVQQFQRDISKLLDIIDPTTCLKKFKSSNKHHGTIFICYSSSSLLFTIINYIKYRRSKTTGSTFKSDRNDF